MTRAECEKKERRTRTLFPSLICSSAISQPMKLSCGDTFLFRGIELKSEMHELLSANTEKLETRGQLLTMGEGELSHSHVLSAVFRTNKPNSL